MAYKRLDEVTLRRDDEPRGDYVAFNEPNTFEGGSQLVVMSSRAVADHMQAKAADCGFCYVSDEQAIIEFMVVHWAWYSDRNGHPLT